MSRRADHRVLVEGLKPCGGLLMQLLVIGVLLKLVLIDEILSRERGQIWTRGV